MNEPRQEKQRNFPRYRPRSKREQAQDHLTTATTMYREMDMRFWLEQAEVEMSGLV
jgi:hypothetical protein